MQNKFKIADLDLYSHSIVYICIASVIYCFLSAVTISSVNLELSRI